MNKLKILITIAATSILIACGGDDSSTPEDSTVTNPPPETGGIVRSGIAFGPVDGFGSIIVNGVRYDTSNATFTIDDMSGTESSLKVGQVVTIKNETDDSGNSNAIEVVFDDDVEGPVDSIDLINSQLVVLGQTVIVTASTIFDDSINPASLEGLTLGDIVEVSGLYNADGVLVASYIEDKPTQTEFEVHGTVTNLDDATMTFSLSNLMVDYSQAVLNDFGSGSLANGDFVEVKGSSFDNTGALIATEVELESNDDRIGDNDDDAEIEGFITEFTSTQSFSVAGVPVITNSSTIFENGIESDLALNVRVEVEGSFNANGELIADKVQLRPEENIEVTSTLDSVDTNAQTITIYGVTFTVDSNTSFDDGSSADVSPFTINDLVSGDYLEVRGFDLNGTLMATRIKRGDFEPESEINGFVESLTTNSVVVLGITINTDASTEYEDIDESILSASEFFNRVTVGDYVGAKGAKTGSNSMLAEELEFEN